MTILGVGGWELMLIIIIAIVVAGPKRLAVWAYTLGQFAAKMQTLWAQFAKSLQTEINQAGINVEIPTSPPTRQDITRSMQKIGYEIVKSSEIPVDELKKEVTTLEREIRAESNAISQSVSGKPEPTKPTTSNTDTAASDDATPNDEEVGFGTWGGKQ